MPSKILMEFCCVGVRLAVKKEILVNFSSTARKSPLAHRPHGHTGIAVLPAARCLPPPVANGARRHGAVGSMYGKTEDLSWSKKSLSFSNVAPSGRLRRLHAAPPTLASCRSCARVRWPWGPSAPHSPARNGLAIAGENVFVFSVVLLRTLVALLRTFGI